MASKRTGKVGEMTAGVGVQGILLGGSSSSSEALVKHLRQQLSHLPPDMVVRGSTGTGHSVNPAMLGLHYSRYQMLEQTQQEAEEA
jgi:hypothetical protein